MSSFSFLFFTLLFTSPLTVFCRPIGNSRLFNHTVLQKIKRGSCGAYTPQTCIVGSSNFYSCQAGNTSYRNGYDNCVDSQIAAENSSGNGLSSGAIAGIVVGVLAILIIISSVVTFLVIKKKRAAAVQGKQGDVIQSANLATPYGEKSFNSSAFVPNNIVPTLPSSPVQAYQHGTPTFASPFTQPMTNSQLNTSTNYWNLTR